MTPDVTSDLLGSGPASSADDPEIERIRALVESRILGGEQPATHIGRFVVLERIGSGGMGVVFAAFDPQLDRKVAIKLLFEGETDERERARLLGEAKAMAKLAHPNVVGVYEVGEHRDRVFIAMEYVRGRTLREWVAERPRSWRETLAMCIQAGRGLIAAHAAGIVHRDFKPDNVLIGESPSEMGESERARVLDFGLARRSAEERSEPGPQAAESSPSDHSLTKLTRTGALVGTPAYMAPEQIRSEVVEAPADQFAFCVATWEALAGERPFAGDTVPRLFDHVIRGELREPPRGAMPGWAGAILRRGLAPKPDQRYPSMHALLAALERGATRRRRVSLFAATAAVALAGPAAWGLWGLELERRRAQCESDAESITEVWNDDVQARLHDALLSTGVAFAESTFEHATPYVDAHVEAWRRDYAELCAATEVERKRSAELWAASRSCFDERRGELGALLDVLTNEADATAAQRTVAAVAGLIPIDVCRDDGWVTRNASLATDDPGLEGLREQSWHAAGLDAAGKYPEALELARSVAGSAADAGQPRLQRSALLLAGTSAQHAGVTDQSQQLLGEAFDLSLIGGDDDAARAAATELVHTLAGQAAGYENALTWGRVARDLQVRSGSGDDLAAARLDEAFAEVYSKRAGRASVVSGGFAEAEELLRRALAIRERLQGPDHPDVGRSSFLLSQLLMDAGWLRPPLEESERLAQRGVTIQEHALGRDHPNVAGALFALGRVQFHRGSYDEALRNLERADSILERSAPDHVDRAGILYYLGSIHQNRGSLEEAQPRYERAITMAERASADSLVPQYMCDLANVHVARGAYDQAQQLFERALALAEHTLDPDNLGPMGCLAFFANLHAIRGSYDESQRLHERALAIGERWSDEIFLTGFLHLFGKMHARRGTHGEAKRLYERSLEIQSRRLGRDWPGQAATLVDLARAELHTDGPERARAHAERAIELAKNNVGHGLGWLVMDEHANASHVLGPSVIPSAQFVLAMVAWSSGDHARAHELAFEARDALYAAGEGFERKLAEVDAWIAAHGHRSRTD